MLEYPRCLFNEASTIFWRRVKDRIEATLTHNDVHLAADTAVAEQLLDVKQAAWLPVDRILGTTRPEQGARDRDLGVLDGQRAVGVVDRQHDLSAAERRLA